MPWARTWRSGGSRLGTLSGLTLREAELGFGATRTRAGPSHGMRVAHASVWSERARQKEWASCTTRAWESWDGVGGPGKRVLGWRRELGRDCCWAVCWSTYWANSLRLGIFLVF
ncbi:unnamed protein product [Prunus armeniaca]